MYATFKNEVTGELRNLKIGFSWTVLFFGGILGIPLFIRRLNVHGSIMAASWFVSFILQAQLSSARTISSKQEIASLVVVFGLVFLVYQIYLAFNANEMAAKNYLTTGWKFADENSDVTKYAKHRWRI